MWVKRIPVLNSSIWFTVSISLTVYGVLRPVLSGSVVC